MIPLKNYEYREIHRITKIKKNKNIPCQNHENHEILKIPCQNNENQEIRIIPCQNLESHETNIYSKLESQKS